MSAKQVPDDFFESCVFVVMTVCCVVGGHVMSCDAHDRG